MEVMIYTQSKNTTTITNYYYKIIKYIIKVLT